MLGAKEMENTYWGNNGKYQIFVEKNLDNLNYKNLKVDKELIEEYEDMAQVYYRFYNDGDKPCVYICGGDTDSEICFLLEIEMNKTIEKIMKQIENNIVDSVKEKC